MRVVIFYIILRKTLFSITLLFLFVTPFKLFSQPCTNAILNPATTQVIPADGTKLNVTTNTTDYFACTVLNGQSYFVYSSSGSDEISVWGTSNGTGTLGNGAGTLFPSATTGTTMWVDLNKSGACGGSATARTVSIELLPYNFTFPSGTFCVGNTITITGSALAYVSQVTFTGGVTATPTGVTGTSFNVVIPAGAISGPLTNIQTNDGTYIITMNAPSVTNSINIETATGISYSPTGGGIGDVITITGSNLLGATNVKINGTTGIGVTVTSTQITFTVAAGTTTGNLTFIDGCGNTVTVGVFTIVIVTNYYLVAGGTVTNLASWGTNTNGTGTAPTVWTASGQRFNIRNNATATLTAAWTVSGAGSGIIVGDGTNPCNFTVPAANAFTGTVINVSANGTLTLQNTTIPTIIASSATGTIVFGNAQSSTVPAITYGNLTIAGTANNKTYTFGGACSIVGTLNISPTGSNNTIVFNGGASTRIFNISNFVQTTGTVNPSSSTGATTVNISGNFTGTGGAFASATAIWHLNFIGGTTQTYSNTGTALNYELVEISNNSLLNLSSNFALGGTGLSGWPQLTVDAGSTLTAGTNLISTNGTTIVFNINGTVQTANTIGFSGTAGTTIVSTNSPTVNLGNVSIIEYNSTLAQAVTSRPDYANVTITSNSTKTPSGSISLSGTLLINTTATFAGSTFIHNIAGNWANNGTFTSNTSTINFNGSTTQAIGGTSSTTFNNLTIANTDATGVNIGIATTVNGALTLTDGYINTTSTNLLTLSSTATSTSGSAISFVNGPIAKVGTAAFVFPTGNGTTWAPIGMSAPAVGSTFTGQYLNHSGKVDGYDTAFAFLTSPLQKVSYVEYWTLNRNVGTDAVTVKLYWENATASGINNCTSNGDLVVAHWNTGTGKWEDASTPSGTSACTGSCGAGQAGTVSTSGAWNSFSPFTFGSKTRGGGINPLPVTLLSFDAKPNGNVVDVKWTTASEFNSDYVMVQRSKDGNNFVDVAKVNASENSSTIKNYSTIDYEPYNDISYYRLKQVDNNGMFTYSDLAAVKFNNADAISVYPNPAESGKAINVSISGQNGKEVLVVIRDLPGREFYSKVILISNDKEVIAIDPSGKLSSGIYFIVATSDNNIYEKKMVIK